MPVRAAVRGGSLYPAPRSRHGSRWSAHWLLFDCRFNEGRDAQPDQALTAHNSKTGASGGFVRNADEIESMGMMPAVLQRWRTHTLDGVSRYVTVRDGQSDRSHGTRQFIAFFTDRAVRRRCLPGHRQRLDAGAMIAASIPDGPRPRQSSAIGTRRHVVGARSAYDRLRQILASDQFTQYRDRMGCRVRAGRIELERVVVMAPHSEQLILKGREPGGRQGFLSVIGPSGARQVDPGEGAGRHRRTRGGGSAHMNWTLSAWHRMISASTSVPQDVQLFPGTVRENIARMAPDNQSEEVIKAAKLAGVHDTILGLPQGATAISAMPDAICPPGSVSISGWPRVLR